MEETSQPYSTTGNIIVLYILIFIFLEGSLKKYIYKYRNLKTFWGIGRSDNVRARNVIYDIYVNEGMLLTY